MFVLRATTRWSSEREGGPDPPARDRHEDAGVAPDRDRRAGLLAVALGTNPEFNTTTVRFNYQSMVTPSSVYDYDMHTRKRTLLKQQEVLGGYDPAHYQARRVWADGA